MVDALAEAARAEGTHLLAHVMARRGTEGRGNRTHATLALTPLDRPTQTSAAEIPCARRSATLDRPRSSGGIEPAQGAGEKFEARGAEDHTQVRGRPKAEVLGPRAERAKFSNTARRSNLMDWDRMEENWDRLEAEARNRIRELADEDYASSLEEEVLGIADVDPLSFFDD